MDNGLNRLLCATEECIG